MRTVLVHDHTEAHDVRPPRSAEHLSSMGGPHRRAFAAC